MLAWEDIPGKASFRMYFNKPDAERYASDNNLNSLSTTRILEGEIFGKPTLHVAFETNSDHGRHVIFLEGENAELWLQNNDSGKMDVRRVKVEEVF